MTADAEMTNGRLMVEKAAETRRDNTFTFQLRLASTTTMTTTTTSSYGSGLDDTMMVNCVDDD